ncbi:MAG TPA: hypothetical protein VLK30_04510 [Candidatus Limnocylindrales bacterium]|nr:hypothetical protein [Candidatus Limnocylindrales bacterium]
MSKRKRAPKQPADESAEDAAVKGDMVHVTPDLLSGSPDIFAGKKADQPPAESEPAADETPAPVADEASAGEPSAEEQPAADLQEPEASEEASGTMEPHEANTALAAEPAAPSETPPPTPPPPYVEAVGYPPKKRSAGSTAALGIVLVVVGLFALAVVLSGVDLTQNGWPLFILIPGLTLLVVGFISFGAAASIPGGIVTMLGLVLAWANSTGDWPVWAYAWALVIPGGIGLGMYLQAIRDRDTQALRNGRNLLFVSLMIFLIGFVLFESILGISGRDYFGNVGKAALPGLLIIVGVILLVRSIQGNRRQA